MVPPPGDHCQPGPRTSDFSFELPDELIADRPTPRRDGSRLMTLDKRTGTTGHHHFADLPELLHPGDLLVLNDTRVFPARIGGVKPRTGGGIELLILEEAEPDHWRAMARGKLPQGEKITLDGGLNGEITAVEGGGIVVCRFDCADVLGHLEAHGRIPLPPYMNREADADDRERYQTVFAREAGSVAAPTSGLHFTPALLAALTKRGIGTCHITLHVGPGTFLPVRANYLADHVMHPERYAIPQQAVDAIGRTRAAGGRIIACGTTVTRTLETAMAHGPLIAHEGTSRLFIHSDYRFRAIDAMVTNFHLPCSTLLMLVSALAGKERVLYAYELAVARRYRFYSYGDGMLIS